MVSLFQLERLIRLGICQGRLESLLGLPVHATVHFVMKLLQSLNKLIREYSLTTHVTRTNIILHFHHMFSNTVFDLMPTHDPRYKTIPLKHTCFGGDLPLL